MKSQKFYYYCYCCCCCCCYYYQHLSLAELLTHLLLTPSYDQLFWITLEPLMTPAITLSIITSSFYVISTFTPHLDMASLQSTPLVHLIIERLLHCLFVIVTRSIYPAGYCFLLPTSLQSFSSNHKNFLDEEGTGGFTHQLHLALHFLTLSCFIF